MRMLWIARHGETEWSVAHRHTGITDLDLTARGERQSHALGERLAGLRFNLVLSSPALRARRTATIAGLGDRMVLEDDLVEFNYGDYEGLTTDEIERRRPGWNLWTNGCPGGETAEEVGERADRILTRLAAVEGDVLTIGHGHMSRILAARFLGSEGRDGSLLMLEPASISRLGFDHGRPAVQLWNDRCHLEELDEPPDRAG